MKHPSPGPGGPVLTDLEAALTRRCETRSIVNDLLKAALTCADMEHLRAQALAILGRVPWIDAEAALGFHLAEAPPPGTPPPAAGAQDPCHPGGAPCTAQRRRIPLVAAGQDLGALVLHVRPSYQPDAHDDAFLDEVASALAAAIVRLRNLAHLQFQSRVLAAVEQTMIATDVQRRVTFWNRGAERMFGHPAAEALGQDALALSTDELSAAQTRELEASLAAGRSWHTEATARGQDGAPFHLLLTVSPVLDGDRLPIGALATAVDITGRKLAEEALRRSEASFRALIEHAPDVVAVHRDGRLVYLNPTGARVFGAAPGTLVGRPVLDFAHPEDRSRIAERMAQVSASGRPQEAEETRYIATDGRVVNLEVQSLPVVFEGLPSALAIGRDLTERRRLEERLVVADRLSSVGLLAAGVGHEINNPLAYIVANLDFARAQLEPAAPGTAPVLYDELRDALRDAREGAERVQAIVRDLQVFSRPEEGSRMTSDLRAVVEPAIGMASNLIRHRARLERSFSVTPPVAADPARLGQVVLNLLVNAAQAIPAGAVDRHTIRVATGTAPDGRVWIEVADTGRGIAHEHLARIFDPFFTTRHGGESRGLGLAICHSIVTAAGGEIVVDSVPGLGSTFRVLLPVEHAASPPTAPAPAAPRGRRGRVLVVDDEGALGRSLARMLRADHDVVLAASGRAACARLDAGERFDAILCDLMMPEMSGMDLYRVVATRWPDLCERFIFMSGGIFAEEAREFLAGVPCPRLAKPFEAAKLRQLLAELLGRNGPQGTG